MTTTASDSLPTDYARRIRSQPVLSAEEEKVLTLEVANRDASSERARGILAATHLRLVTSIANRMRGYGISFDELVAEGSVGLVRAIDKFDPDRGFRLSTYAMWWIRASIQEYVLRNHSIVKMGSTLESKKLFFGLKRAKERIRVMDGREMTPDEVDAVAIDLGVSREAVVEADSRLGRRSDFSLDTPVYAEIEGMSHVDMLVSEGADQFETVSGLEMDRLRREAVAHALERLTPREQRIIISRKLDDDPMTLEQLSVIYGLTRERIRQIEVKALEKIRQSVFHGFRVSHRSLLAA